MGKLSYGLFGPVSGRVGPIVGASWKGTPYLRSAPKKRTGKASPSETATRTRFALSQTWLQPVLDFVRQGFKNYNDKLEGFGAAKSWMLRNSFEGISPNIFINSALVKLSHGSLPLSGSISAEKTIDGQVKFSWNRNPIPDANPKDQAMLLAYDIDHSFANYSLNGQFRDIGSDLLQLPKNSGRTYHIYFAFVAHDRSRQSDSVYLGTIGT